METHPDRLAAVGRLFGMRPAPVAECSVLEIGCGDGSNLVPMAYGLPGSFAVGVDLAPGPIAAAQRMAGDLELSNIRLVTADLRDIDEEYGTFDYVIAHGVYSWVPADVREGLLRVCAERLAPQGIAFVSYNVFPGRQMRQLLREMMLYQTRRAPGPRQRIEQARSFLHTIAEGRLAPPAWRELLQQEATILLEKDAGSFWHDDLAPVNQPMYFHEFAAQAAGHGLQYLGDADSRVMFDPWRSSGEAPEDPLECEQYLDFLRCRRFRESLLCRADVALDRNPGPERMREFLFAAPSRRAKNGEIEGLNGVRVAPGHVELEAIVSALGDAYPLPLSFDDLAPYGGEGLEEILFALVRSGFASFHVHDFPCEETVTPRPCASHLARWQAERGSLVTNACHMPVQLEDADVGLLLQLDGTRAVAESEALAWFARMGLLEG
jgi:SAM-dependent methyltransferase